MAMDLDELDVLDEDVIETPELEHQEEVTSTIDIPDDDDEDDNDSIDQTDNNNDNNDQDSDESDAISKFLKSKGISDPTKIKFENDEGEIEEVSWDELSEEEKLNILNTDDEIDEDTELDDSEIDLINRMRLSGMNVNDFINFVKQQGAAEYALSIQNQQPVEQYNYTVDDLSDEELYVLDLLARIEDISDEECKEALERAMANESLFKKEVAGLREDYKRLEDDRNEREQAIQLQQLAELFQIFSNNIVNGINSFTNIGELDVDMNNDDKDLLYEFITGVDNTGVNHFAKALTDPETIVKTAWFALHGEDIINNISEYYKELILLVAKANYERGLNESKSKKSSDRKVVVKKLPKQENQNIKSIDDLD